MNYLRSVLRRFIELLSIWFIRVTPIEHRRLQMANKMLLLMLMTVELLARMVTQVTTLRGSLYQLITLALHLSGMMRLLSLEMTGR